MDPNKIDSNVLTYYLNRINSFLTSPKTSQVFPGLSKDVEDVLVKLAGQDDLKLEGFDDDFKALVSVIKSMLERKKCEYRLICNIQKLSCGTRSLIYTKTMIPVTFEQPQPLRKPNSMSETNNQPPLVLSSKLTTQSFKLQCLNSTIKFVKDESRLTLRYPDMPTKHVEYILHMFEQNNSDGDSGMGYKTLYAPLWEAMSVLKLKYKFTLRYTDPKDKDMKCLVLDKIPIVQASKNKENQDQNKQTLKSQPDDLDQNISKISLMDISDQNIFVNINISPTNNIKIDIDENKNMDNLIKPGKLDDVPKLMDKMKLNQNIVEDMSFPDRNPSLRKITKRDPVVNNDKESFNSLSINNTPVGRKITKKNTTENEDTDFFKRPPKLNDETKTMDTLHLNIDENMSISWINIDSIQKKTTKIDTDETEDMEFFKKPTQLNDVPKTKDTSKLNLNVDENMSISWINIDSIQKKTTKIDTDENEDMDFFKKPTQLNDVPKTKDTSKLNLNVDENMSISWINIDSIQRKATKIDKNENRDMEIYKKPPKLIGQPKLMDTIKLLGDNYMIKTFGNILDFVMDKAAASMICYKIPPDESRILIHWTQIMNTDKYKLLLSPKCLSVLNQLSYNYGKMEYRIQVCEGRKKKGDNLRDITFKKVVNFGKKSPREENHGGSLTSLNSVGTAVSANTKSSGRKTSASKSSARRDESAKRDASASRSSARRDASAKRDTSARRDASVSRSSTKRDASASRTSARRDASAKRDASARHEVSAGRSSARQASAATYNTNANKIKMKLLEGLDQPVTSHKAMKMMLNMGWAGGALGRRGEGIVEPIRPYLDNGNRQGLGAPKEEPAPILPHKTKPIKTLPSHASRSRVTRPDSPTTTKQYHMESLKLILNLLNSTSNTKEITFPESNISKEWGYVKNIVISLNKGIQIGGKKSLNYRIMEEIFDIMFDTEWILTAGLRTDRITIVIKKSILPLLPEELKVYCEVAAFRESKIDINNRSKVIYKGLIKKHKKYIKKHGPIPMKQYLKIKNYTEDILTKKSNSPELDKRSGTKDEETKETAKIDLLDDVPKKAFSTELNTRSGSKDQTKESVEMDLLDDIPKKTCSTELNMRSGSKDQTKGPVEMDPLVDISTKTCLTELNMRSGSKDHTKEPVEIEPLDDIPKKTCSTELKTRSGSKDQTKEPVEVDPVDDIPYPPLHWLSKKELDDIQKATELTDDFKNNVLGNILLFCQTDIEHKVIKFKHYLVKNQRTYIEECIEKANNNSCFMERNLESRFYQKIIAAMDGYKIAVVFSSPCTINLQKEYTIHYYDEDIDTDGENID